MDLDNTGLKLSWIPLRTERSNIRTSRRKTPSAYRKNSQGRKEDYENRKQNDNVNVNPGSSVPPKSFTSISIAFQCELINNTKTNPDNDTSLNMMPVRKTRAMSNHPEIPWNCNSVSKHICLLSPEHPDIALNQNAQTFSSKCTLDLLADELVSTEID